MERIVNIIWEGPYSLDSLKELRNEDLDYGIYQIYGSHNVYGSNKLLYIGKANQQTFGVRINQENWFYNSDSDGVQVYVGRLGGNGAIDIELWETLIDQAEKLLIFSHSPAFNSHSINTLGKEKDIYDLHILNWNCYKDLMPEVSGARWTSRYDDEICNVYNINNS